MIRKTASRAPQQNSNPSLLPHGKLQREDATHRRELDELKQSDEAISPRSAMSQEAAPASTAEPPAGSAGQPLDDKLRGAMELRFGHDFSRVRVHSDARAVASARSLGARAFTIGENIWLGAQQRVDGTVAGRQLLAHELSHVVQQSRGQATGLMGATGETNRSEQEAKQSASIVGAGGLVEVRSAARPGSLQLSPLTTDLTAAMTGSGGKGEVFNLLRARGPITGDPDLGAWLDATFGPNTNPATMTDDRWLADQLVMYGSEPRWPQSAFLERERRAHNPAPGRAWGPEAGNIEASFSVGAGRTPIRAYYFPGTSDRRAMIVGGVHGTEAAGVEVVNRLLAQMRAPGAPMPYYTVIIVPVLFPANRAANRRRTPGRVDPNRQMPAVGAAPSSTDSMGRAVEPENMVLLDLIERFQPERIASVHGHSPPRPGGADMPGITTDPRPGRETEDDALALRMATAAAAGGVRVPGNRLGTTGQTTRYPTSSAPHDPGVTFGEYGSRDAATRATATAPAGTRPAMNVILIETFDYYDSAHAPNRAAAAARRVELETLATVLRTIFLGPNPTP